MFVFKSSLPLPMAMRWGWLDWPGYARWSVTLAYVVLVNWLLLAPGKTFRDIHLVLAGQDKVAHFGIFCVLTGLFCWSVPGPRGTRRKRAVIVLAMVGYGVAIECIQPLIPNSGRSFEWMDMLLDGMGVAAGLWACERLARRAENSPGELKIEDRRSEIRDQRSEIGDQRSEIRDQRSEIGD